MLFDQFDILFRVNSRDAQRDLDKVSDSADKTEKSFQDADKQSENLSVGMKDLAKTALGAVAAFASLGAAVGGAMERAREIDQISQVANTLGESAGDVDALGKVFQEFGGEAKDAQDSLVDMAEAIGDAMNDTEGSVSQAMQALGLNITDGTGKAIGGMEGLLRLSDAMSKYDKQTAIFRAKEMGITDNATINLLMKGRKELERMIQVQKDRGVVTQVDIDKAREAREAMGKLSNSWERVTTTLLSGLAPALTVLADALADGIQWISEHKEGVIAFAAVLGTAMIPVLVSMAAAGWAAIAPFLAMAAPFIAVGAAIALVVDDIMNFIDGNKSLIGQIVNEYPIVGEIFSKIGEVFGVVGDAVMSLPNLISKAWDKAKEFFAFFFDAGTKVGEWFGSLFGDGEVKANMTVGNAQLAAAGANPLNSTTSSSISNSTRGGDSTSVNVENLNVEAKGVSADDVASGAVGALNEQLKKTKAGKQSALEA